MINGIKAMIYHKKINGADWSLGRFFLNEKEIFRAWGLVSDEYCSFNMVNFDTGWSPSMTGCPDIEVKDEYLILKAGEQKIKHSVILLS